MVCLVMQVTMWKIVTCFGEYAPFGRVVIVSPQLGSRVARQGEAALVAAEKREACRAERVGAAALKG